MWIFYLMSYASFFYLVNDLSIKEVLSLFHNESILSSQGAYVWLTFNKEIATYFLYFC